MARFDLLGSLGVSLNMGNMGDCVDGDFEIAFQVRDDTPGGDLHAIDISDPNNISILDTYDFTATGVPDPNFSPRTVEVDSVNKLVIVAGFERGADTGILALFSYTSGGLLSFEDSTSDSFPNGGDFFGLARHLWVAQNRVYVPRQDDYALNTYSYQSGSFTKLTDVTFNDRPGVPVLDTRAELLWVPRTRLSDGKRFTRVYDVANGSVPVLLDEFDGGLSAGIAFLGGEGDPNTSRPSGYFFCPDPNGGVFRVMRWDGVSITQHDSFSVPGARGLTVNPDGTRVFVISDSDATEGDLYIYDVSDINNISLIQSIEGWANSPAESIDLPLAFILYGDGTRGFVADRTNDYVGVWATGVTPNDPPNKPVCHADNVGLYSVVLGSSVFSDPDGTSTHQSSRWQIDEEGGDFSAPLYDSGDVSDLLSHESPSTLETNTTYIARVLHTDDNGADSAWSDAVTFKTQPLPKVTDGVQVCSLPDVTPFSPDKSEDHLRFARRIDHVFDLLLDCLNTFTPAKAKSVESATTGTKGAVLNLFFQTFDDAVEELWNVRDGSSDVVTYTENGQTGGVAFRATGGDIWIAFPENLPFDPSRKYRIRTRARLVGDPSVTGTALFRCGVEGIGADGSAQVNINGNDSHQDQHFVAAHDEDLEAVTLGEWQTYVGYFQGTSATPTQGPSTDPSSPKPLHSDVRYMRPVFVLNWQDGDGIMEIDYIAIDVITESDEVDSQQIKNAAELVRENDSITRLVDRTADNIAETATRKWAGETGADVTADNPQPFSWLTDAWARLTEAQLDSVSDAGSGNDLTIDVSWTPGSEVADGSHELEIVYFAIEGSGYRLLGSETITDPVTTTSSQFVATGEGSGTVEKYMAKFILKGDAGGESLQTIDSTVDSTVP